MFACCESARNTSDCTAPAHTKTGSTRNKSAVQLSANGKRNNTVRAISIAGATSSNDASIQAGTRAG